MEKIMGTICGIFLMLQQPCNAEDAVIIRKGLLRAQATLAPAIMFSSKQSLFYLHGNLEGYFTPKISIAGEAYVSLGNTSVVKPTFAFNHNIFFGASYHLVKKNNDFYIGFQPGISISKLMETPEIVNKPTVGVNPLASLVIGYNYYVHRYFHFFVQTRFIAGQHLYNEHKDLSEFRFSAGLGFNINTIKNKQ